MDLETVILLNNNIVHDELPGWIGGAIALSFALGILACQLFFLYRERSTPMKITR